MRAGTRLVDSPAVALNSDTILSPAMRRMLRTMKDDEAGDEPRLDLEINPRHPLVHSLNELRSSNPERAALICEQLHDNALLAAGIVEEPRLLVGRLNKLLEMAAK